MSLFTKIFITALLFFQISSKAQSGCTDPLATNYNATATINDGSCIYATASVTPYNLHTLSDTLAETSGLVWHNNLLWTHNDNSDAHLYAIDTIAGKILKHTLVSNGVNTDWEEIAQDSNYFYIGDFGNNANGNRTDLHILRIAKNTLNNSAVAADTIRFVYADQTDFSNSGANNTDFDCEAFVATNDGLYLFTKQWVSKKTSVYSLPKIPSSIVDTAILKATYDVQGLISGATYLKDKNVVVLTGYNTNFSTFLNPFVYLLYDFAGNDFFSGNKRKIDVTQPLSQIEAIATTDGKSFFLTNETLGNSIITIPQRLQKIDLSAYLNNYYQTALAKIIREDDVRIYPNPATNAISVQLSSAKQATAELLLIDAGGKTLMQQKHTLQIGKNNLQVRTQATSGTYFLLIKCEGQTLTRKVYLQE